MGEVGANVEIPFKEIETEVKLPEFDFKNIRNYDHGTLMRELVRKYDEDYVPSLDEFKILICNWVSKGDEDDESLPWPEGVNKRDKVFNDGLGWNLKEYRNYENVIAISKKEGKLTDEWENGWGVDRKIINIFLDKLEKKDLIELNKYVVENYKFFDESESENWEYMDDLLRPLGDDNKEDMVVLGKDFLGLIYSSDANKAIREGDYMDGEFFDVDTYKNTFLTKYPDLLVKSWINWDWPENIRNRTMGILLKTYGIADVANIIRKELKEGYLSNEDFLKYEGLGRSILNLPKEYPLHTDLGLVYKNTDFGSYKLSLETEKFRVGILGDLFRDLGVDKTDKIMDLACGTGWLVGDLIENGYKNTVGVDVSEKHLDVARQNYGDNFVLGDWYNLEDNFDKQKVVLCLGRSLTHVENEWRFGRALRQIGEVAQDDGYFIFDMPDSEAGGGQCKERLQGYRDTLEKFGFEKAEVDDVWTIVDSPDKKNFYNRYVPSRGIIEGALNGFGFEVLKVISEKLPGSEKDKNMVFVCKKRSF